MGPVRDRLRYAIARLLDRLPGQCSTSIWQWANRSGPRTSPWSPNQLGCAQDAARNGHCRCGKLTTAADAPIPAPDFGPNLLDCPEPTCNSAAMSKTALDLHVQVAHRPAPARLIRPAIPRPARPAGVASYCCSACLWPHPPGQHTPPGQLPDGDA